MAAALAEAKTALEGANAARVVEVAAAKTGPGHVAAASRAKRAEAQTSELRSRLTEAEQAAQRAAAEAQRARAEVRACPTSTKRTSRTRNSSPTRSASFVKRRTASRDVLRR